MTLTISREACTPAMAAGLTDHVWSVFELLTYRIAPPPWVEPKRRGRPSKQAQLISIVGKPPRVRLRKVVLTHVRCSIVDRFRLTRQLY